jgi:hypothetical protein
MNMPNEAGPAPRVGETLKGNSIRVRLDRRDIEGLIDRGRIDAAVRFGPGSDLAFS